MTESRRGLYFGIAAYTLWGIAPLYWRLLADVDPVEVLAHRGLWGAFAFLALVRLARAGAALRTAARDRRVVLVMALSGVLLAVNWGTFVWSIGSGHLLDSSLGYFINPLVSVALGTLVLGERLRRLQWIAIGFAIAGVVVLAVRVGHVPWISLLLAATFGLYGLVRKRAPVDSLVGSTIETAILAAIAAVYLGVLALRGGGALGHAPVGTQVLLASAGVITAIPLILFTSATRRLPLSTVGMLQYLSPTGQFLLAVFAFHEPFAADKLVAFGLIWVGLIAFSIDLARSRTT